MSLVASTSAAKAENVNEFDEGLTPETVEKYRNAANIANDAVKAVVAKLAPGAKIVELCKLGDTFITDRLKKLKGKEERGIAFPTSVSVNNCAGHFSPLADNEEVLREGDLVKIDLAVHIDGYIASSAQTALVATDGKPVTGRVADVVAATYQAAEIVAKLAKVGKTNAEITEAIQKVAAAYNVKPLEGVLSHQVSRYVLDGEKVIINKQDVEHQVDSFTFVEGEAFTFDIVFSTGEGKAQEISDKSTIYKRNAATTYSLKLTSARAVFGEILRRFPSLPFVSRSLEDKRARLGILECLKHDLLHSFPVLYEKEGEFIAQAKFTVLITKTGTQRITDLTQPNVKSELKLEDPSLLTALSEGAKKKNKPKKKKSKAAKEGTSADAEGEEEEGEGEEEEAGKGKEKEKEVPKEAAKEQEAK